MDGLRDTFQTLVKTGNGVFEVRKHGFDHMTSAADQKSGFSAGERRDTANILQEELYRAGEDKNAEPSDLSRLGGEEK